MIKLKKIRRSSELMWILGTIFVALGVTICKKADLGISMIAAPPFIIYEAIKDMWSGFSVGMVEYLVQGVALIILCLVVRKFNWRYLLAFLVAIIYGYVLDMWLFIFKDVHIEAIYLRWIFLFIGDIVVALGVSCYFRTYLPLQVYELFVSEVSKTYSFKITKVKLCFDLCFLVLSFVLAVSIFRDINTFDWSTIYYSSYHTIGLGTIVTTLINAPIIAIIGKILDSIFEGEALFPKLKDVLERK